MSVLSCNRHSCPNIMCDRHSNEYGYICNDCFNELVTLGVNTDIADFLNTPKTTQRSKIYVNPEEYFGDIFSIT